MSGVRGQELLMEPSIEITYDPTIKVRGITEELFKQQPEGKFVLKPFTIISKKVYKNFTDRSHAFNYLLKFLKKKSKEDNNVILKVFSEPRESKKRNWFYIFLDNFILFIGSILVPRFNFSSSAKLLTKAFTSISKILTLEQKEKFYLFELTSKLLIILIISGLVLFTPQMKLIPIKNDFYFLSFLLTMLNILWGMFFGASIIGLAVIFVMIEKTQPEMIRFFQNYIVMLDLIVTIEESKLQNNNKTILIINFDIYLHFDPDVFLNFISYLLKSINDNKNISTIINIQDSNFISYLNHEFKVSQRASTSFFLEDRLNKTIQLLDNSVFAEEYFPISKGQYERQKELEESRKKNKKLERENKEQLARIIQSAKLESMNITTSGVSHEMRNPLSIIQLVIENLRMEKNLTKEVLLEDLDKIQTQISRIYKLTETFQKFSAQKNLTKKSIDTQITNSLYFFEQRLLSNKIEVNYDKPEESIGAIEFSEELSIVIENLISNAIDALKGNPDAKIGIRINLANDKLEIKFSDNGHGIPQESIKEIFTPLYTTKGPGQGTGLGLWLCYTIVKDNLKGDIRVDSPPNEGTTFTILLPIDGDKDV